jgi:hypothetical protein
MEPAAGLREGGPDWESDHLLGCSCFGGEPLGRLERSKSAIGGTWGKYPGHPLKLLPWYRLSPFGNLGCLDNRVGIRKGPLLPSSTCGGTTVGSHPALQLDHGHD